MTATIVEIACGHNNWNVIMDNIDSPALICYAKRVGYYYMCYVHCNYMPYNIIGLYIASVSVYAVNYLPINLIFYGHTCGFNEIIVATLPPLIKYYMHPNNKKYARLASNNKYFHLLKQIEYNLICNSKFEDIDVTLKEHNISGTLFV